MQFRHAWLLLALWLSHSQPCWAGLIIDAQALQTRVQVESQVTDASFGNHVGTDKIIISSPSPASLTLGPFTSSVSDTSGDSGYGHVESFSYSYSSSMIASSGSISASATFDQGRIQAVGEAAVAFNSSASGFLTVDHATPFTLVTSFSKTMQSSLGVSAGVSLADTFGNYLLDRSFFTFAPESQTFTDSGMLLPGVQYVLRGDAALNDRVIASHPGAVSDDTSFSFVLTVAEPSSAFLLGIACSLFAAFRCGLKFPATIRLRW